MEHFDFTELKSMLINGEISKELYRNIVVNAALQHFEHELDFTYVDVLGYGGFGDVFLFRTPVNLNPVAIKIIVDINLCSNELEKWHELRHPNIQRLTAAMNLDPIPAVAFFMTVQEKDLGKKLRDPEFKQSSDAIRMAKVWIREVLEGLSYMHSRELCHLDLKSTNILLTENNRALITDFSTLQPANVQTTWYGVPGRYRPPETFLEDGNPPVQGIPFDLWTLGMMAFNILTGYIYAENVPPVSNWAEDAYPTMFHILQDDNLILAVQRAFPRAEIDNAEIKIMKNFLLMLLKINPAKRPTAEQALHHAFLEEGGVSVELDEIWIEKARTEDVLDLMTFYNLPQSNAAVRLTNTIDNTIQQPTVSKCLSVQNGEGSRTVAAAEESNVGRENIKCIEDNTIHRDEKEIMDEVKYILEQTEDVIDVMDNAEDVLEHMQKILDNVEQQEEAIGEEDRMNEPQVSVNVQHIHAESENTKESCSRVPKGASKSLTTRISHWVRKNIFCCFRCCCRRSK